MDIAKPKSPKIPTVTNHKRRKKAEDEKIRKARLSFGKKLTPNQKEWLNQIARISRFEKRHKVNINIPKTPKRITKKDIEEIKKLRGCKLYDISTVEAGRDITIIDKHYQQGDEVPVSEIIEQIVEDEIFNERPTEEDIQSALKDIKTEKEERTKFSDVYMDEFYTQILDRTADLPILQSELMNVFSELENLLNADNKEIFDIIRDFENKQKRDLLWLLRYEPEYTHGYFRDFAGYIRQNYSWSYYEVADYLDSFADQLQNNQAVWEELYVVRSRQSKL